tara:strand:+ start:1809 stop:2078 length:270 start_codon:yes stop_codon:yes gene_type:complete
MGEKDFDTGGSISKHIRDYMDYVRLLKVYGLEVIPGDDDWFDISDEDGEIVMLCHGFYQLRCWVSGLKYMQDSEEKWVSGLNYMQEKSF